MGVGLGQQPLGRLRHDLRRRRPPGDGQPVRRHGRTAGHAAIRPVAATASSDTTAPTSTISSPADGATVPVGQPLTVSGTATDAGGGKVGGVEVSTDNGTSWHPATGRGSWSYTFTPGSNGTLTIRTRATDDSLRTETPSAGRTITVGTGTPPPPGSCPCSIWPSTATPAVASDPDSSAIEVGVKFRANQAGFISGIRFYKGSGNTGTHVGSLWSASGTKLGSATFTGESALRLAAGELRLARSRLGQHHLCRLVLRA